MTVEQESNVETDERPGTRGFDDEEQQVAYEEIRDLLDGKRHGKAKAWYEVGEKIAEVIEASEYGARAVVTIAENLGLDASLLYNAKRVSNTWTQEEFEALMSRRDAVRGNLLSWSHVVELAGVSDSDRDQILGRVLGEGLSVRGLKRLIREPDNSSSEEAPENSQSMIVMRALRNFKAESETIVEKAARYETSIFAVLGTPENRELGMPRVLELLKDARETQLRVKQTCEEQLVKLDAYIIRSEELQTTTEGDIQGTSPESEQTRGEE